jgi:hypothetical protein
MRVAGEKAHVAQLPILASADAVALYERRSRA